MKTFSQTSAIPMKRITRLLGGLFIGASMMTLVACGGGNKAEAPAAKPADAPAATAAAGNLKLGVSMARFDDPFLTIIRNGMKTHAEKQSGVAVQFEDAQDDVGKQLNQVQNFISQKVSAIIVNPVDTDATPKITELATKAGIPLIYVNRQPSEEKLPEKVAYVGSNDLESGTLQMQEVCKLMNGKGNILVMMGKLSNQAARLRTKDIEDVISKEPCTGIKIEAKQTAEWDRTKATDLMTNWLTAGKKFDAVVANNDEMAIGAIQALKAANKMKPEMIVAGIDATTDGLNAMKAGDLKVTVFQNATGQGQGAVDTALKLAKGDKVEPFVWVPFELVTPANLDKYLNKN